VIGGKRRPLAQRLNPNPPALFVASRRETRTSRSDPWRLARRTGCTSLASAPRFGLRGHRGVPLRLAREARTRAIAGPAREPSLSPLLCERRPTAPQEYGSHLPYVPSESVSWLLDRGAPSRARCSRSPLPRFPLARRSTPRVAGAGRALARPVRQQNAESALSRSGLS
jgi:hypothetical protein